MLVKVKLYGHLPDLAGKDEFGVEVTAPTVRGLLEAMKKSCPAALMSALVDPQFEPPELLVVAAVDNMPTFYSEGIDSELKEGSEVVFMPALAGGQLPRYHRPPCL
ncbi:MAG: MoaD/ThiS family protein [Chloroflexi bacterium]|nr:MoaD/ThiS family protein [Chloroflexota bacterium]